MAQLEILGADLDICVGPVSSADSSQGTIAASVGGGLGEPSRVDQHLPGESCGRLNSASGNIRTAWRVATDFSHLEQAAGQCEQLRRDRGRTWLLNISSGESILERALEGGVD
eukprot:g21768.t1